ncbi:MAG TPA: COX15/CtaA family protein [Tepidisphaeraceae bacterium]|jgi:cytochrome c oxidase assembly protein subunit 15|nr:COX15/CtaA family protein [Tepidisphaeraceae bacterium]
MSHSIDHRLPFRSEPEFVEPRAPYNPWLHRAAWVTALSTFPLIFMGGLVTSHGAGMSVPDWPNSYGYNMFAFPFSQWLGPDKGGIFYEHSHRLLASFVGFLAIVVTIIAWRTEGRRWVRWLATGVLALVIFQGVLGGLRVVWVDLKLAVVHACVAQAFFCLATLLVIVTSSWWLRQTPPLITLSRGRFLIIAALAATGMIYLQLIIGALMRHYDAGLAIPDLPFAYGRLLPPVSEEGLLAVNKIRAWELHIQPVESLTQIWLHFGHRVGAIFVTSAILTLVGAIFVRHRADRVLLPWATVLLLLLVTQVTLGVYTVLKGKPADIATLHVACGALVLATSFVLTIMAIRLYWARPTPQNQALDKFVDTEAQYATV